MPACSVCVRRLIGGNVKTATAIFHRRGRGGMTQAVYLGEAKGSWHWATDLPRPSLPYHFSLYGSDYCLTGDLKSKVSLGWKQHLAVVSHSLNDTDRSCFVKLYAEVITLWQTRRDHSNYLPQDLKPGSWGGCKLCMGCGFRMFEFCVTTWLHLCSPLSPNGITFPPWITLFGLWPLIGCLF